MPDINTILSQFGPNKPNTYKGLPLAPTDNNENTPTYSDTYQKIFGNAPEQPSLTQQKQQEVIQASNQKLSDMGSPNYYRIASTREAGANTNNLPNSDKDLATLNPLQLAQKYGVNAARELENNYIQKGYNQFNSDLNASRSVGQHIGDDTLAVGSGLATGIGGLASIGALSLGSLDGSMAITRGTDQLNKWLSSKQSDELSNSSKATQAMTDANIRDNKQQYNNAINEGDNHFIANLSLIGKNALSSVTNPIDNPDTLEQGTANAIGSLLLGGPATKGVSAVGTRLIPSAIREASGMIGDRAPSFIANAALEGSNTYQQTASQVLGMSDDDLQKSAPNYQNILNSVNGDKNKAKEIIARNAAVTAGLEDAPLGGLAGSFTKGLQLNPFRASSLGNFASNIGKEAIEEGVQGGTQQLLQNNAVKDNADKNQDLLDGVGEQIGQGALFGAMAAGTTESIGIPGAIKNDISSAVKNRLDTINSKRDNDLNNEAENSLQDIDSNLNDIQNNKQEDQSDLTNNTQEDGINAENQNDIVDGNEKINTNDISMPHEDVLKDYASKISSIPEEFKNNENIPDDVSSVINNSKNKVDMIYNLGKFLNDPDISKESQVAATHALLDSNSQISNFYNNALPILNNLDDENPLKSSVNNVLDAITKVGSSPHVINAVQSVINSTKQDMENGDIHPIPENTEELNKPEEQTNLNNAINSIELNPTSANPDVIDSIVKHSNDGTINISPRQQIALNTAHAISKSLIEFNKDNESSPLTTNPMNLVTREATTNDKSETEGDDLSSIGHIQNIKELYNQGNIPAATEAMNRFGLYAQHLQNKVGAINEHLQTGGGKENPSVHYQSLRKGKTTFTKSASALGVTPTSPNSVKFAQTLDNQANMTTRLYNNITQVFPLTNAKPIKGLRLDSSLRGNIDDVVSNFRNGTTNTNVSNINDNDVVQKLKKEEERKEEPKNENSFEGRFNSLNTNNNLFLKNFKVKKNVKPLPNNPIKEFINHINNEQTLTKDSKDDYESIMDNAHDITQIIHKSLNEKLFKNDSSLLKQYKEGKPINSYMSTLVTNFFNNTDKDIPKYDNKVIETAVLAGLQWLIRTPAKGNEKDINDIKNILGAGEYDHIDNGLVGVFNSGLTQVEAVDSLGSMIMRFLGVVPSNKEFLGISDGIKNSIGAEVLSALIKHGFVEKETLGFDKDNKLTDDLTNVVKKLVLLHPKETTDNIAAYPDAIEKAFTSEQELTHYFDNDKVPVRNTVINSDNLKVTDYQKSAIKNSQEGEYYIHEPTYKLYKALGSENMLDMFGYGELDSSNSNRNDYLSKKGKNTSVLSGLKAIESHYVAALVKAKELGISIDKLKTKYAFGVTSVGRMQNMSPVSPQSDKSMREYLLPTNRELDLQNKEEHKKYFNVALAQAFDLKVHKLSFDEIKSKVNNLLSNDYAEAIQHLANWLDNDSNKPLSKAAITSIKEAVSKAGGTQVALMAMMEYARYSNMDDVSKFNTPLYIESDGIANGVSNAMVIHTVGDFTAQWVKSTAKGGLLLDGKKTANEEYTKDNGVDVYGMVANSLQNYISALYTSYKGSELQSNFDSVNYIFNKFIKDVSVENDGDGNINLSISRGVTKNPIMITVYGSGSKGISENFANEFLGNFYSYMSNAIKDGSLKESLFGGQDYSLNQMNKLMNEFNVHLSKLLTTSVRKDEKNRAYIDSRSNKIIDFNKVNYKNFTLNDNQFNNLSNNILHFFISPLENAITDVVGSGLMDSRSLIIQSTNAQSTLYSLLFKKMIDDKIKWHEENTEGYKKWMYVTSSDIDSIKESLKDIAPLVHAGDQKFMLTKSKLINSKSFNGRSLDESKEYGVNVIDRKRVPAPSGVLAAPAMTIGLGDASMMLHAFNTLKEYAKRVVGVYDGQNISVGDAAKVSEIMNQSVHKSWDNNALEAIHNTFSSMYNSPLLKENFSYLKELPEFKDLFSTDYTTFLNELTNIKNELSVAAKSINNRSNVLNRVNHTIDQMAGIQVGYTHNGEESFEDMSPEDIATRLNQLLNTKEEKKKEKVNPTVNNFGRIRKGGAREIASSNIPKMVKAIDMDDTHKKVLLEMAHTLALKGLKIVVGNQDQINNYTNNTGKSLVDISGSNGAYSLLDNTIYLANPTNEVLAHEVVHAATLQKVLDHYNGKTNPVISTSIKSIEGLMKDFKNIKDIPSKYINSVNDMNNSIANAVNSTNDAAIAQAKALNEFMSWVLTNKDLANVAQKTKSSFFTYVGNALKSIKDLIWGKRRFNVSPKLDIYSNLLFHTSIIARGNPTLSERVGDLLSYHSNAFGSDQRLSDLNNKVINTIKNYLDNETNIQKHTNSVNNSKDSITTAKLYQEIKGAFQFNKQQETVFESLVPLLISGTKLDGNTLSRVSDLYNHFIKTASVEDLMINGTNRAIAQEKLNSILGVNMTTKDRYNRSTILPAFLALSMIDDDFREVLSNMKIPSSKKYNNDSIDNLLNNAGNYLLEQIGAKLAKDSLEGDIRSSMDDLVNQLLSTSEEAQGFIDQYNQTVTSNADRADEIVSNQLDKLMQKTFNFAQKNIDNSPNGNKRVKQLNHALKWISSIASKSNHNNASSSVSKLMANVDGFNPLRRLVTDFIGREEGEAGEIYDLIKAGHSISQKIRQEFKENVPAYLETKFKKVPNKEQLSHLHETLIKTDITSLFTSLSKQDFSNLINNNSFAKTIATSLENELKAENPNTHDYIITKAKELADNMINGTQYNNFVSNAYAISRELGLRTNSIGSVKSNDYVNKLDRLISVYAHMNTSDKAKSTLRELFNKEQEAITYLNKYLEGQRTEEKEKEKNSISAKLNGIKGYSPIASDNNATLKVVGSKDVNKYKLTSMKVIGEFKTPFIDRELYMFSTVSSKSAFNQGIIQNIRKTINGVDAATGRMYGLNTAGSITDKDMINKITASKLPNYKPVFNNKGVIVAYDKAIDPQLLEKLEPNTDILSNLGLWRGRQFEESVSLEFNKGLVDLAKQMYDNRTKDSDSEYVDLFGNDTFTDDPIIQDALKLMPNDIKDYAKQVFGGQFMVHKNLSDDMIGYRSASIGDFFTGTSRYSEKTQEAATNFARAIFGDDAYKYLVKSERFLQNWVSNSKVTVVVKSIVVPFSNAKGNLKQLAINGVPLNVALSKTPKKIAEINYYMKNSLKLTELDADLRATNGRVNESKRIQSQIQAINDSFKNLSIYPLIENNEFSSVADMGITRDDISLSEGKLIPYIEQLVNKLPDSMKTAGRYALVTKDTSLFQGLQKAVEYGDFVAKAIYYDHLIEKKTPKKEALAIISEEFINYDRLSGRFRQYAESIGLGWYYNFKLRSTKIAAKELRNNPVRSLIYTVLPLPSIIKDIGTPITDNFVTQLLDGKIGNSIGIGEIFSAPKLNPWVNIIRSIM